MNGPELTKSEIEQAKRLSPLLEERESPMPQAWPSRYRALAIKALRRGEIAIGRFAEYLNISRHEAMRFVEQEVPDGDEVQNSGESTCPPSAPLLLQPEPRDDRRSTSLTGLSQRLLKTTSPFSVFSSSGLPPSSTRSGPML